MQRYSTEHTSNNTESQFDNAMSMCKDIYLKKILDYGAAWRILRPSSVTDQLFIKASRIRTLESGVEAKVNEGIKSEIIALVNYSVIGIIQLELGYVSAIDITDEKAIKLYEKHVNEAKKLMIAKNHDYNEAWRIMRVESYTDLILQKINRIKNIEDNNGNTIISEGVEANYFDIINYAIFYLIKLTEQQSS